MNSRNGSLNARLNQSNFFLNKKVELTEDYLFNTYTERFNSELSINNLLRDQKKLAMITSWKVLTEDLICVGCGSVECVCRGPK
jgi:hypothetical protein